MNSLIQKEKECYICKTTLNLHKHHIFEGRNRNNSEKYGCWVYLCAKHHNMSDEGVHFNKKLDSQLKIIAQKRFEEVYPDKEFLDIFKINYL